jgi:predicted DNA-binding transcriptional regulator AlpA
MMMLQQHGQAGVDEQTVELIAARVTAALRDDLELLLATFTQRERSTRSLTVEQLAARLGVARSTVYAHWRESGGYKLGSGPRAPIHFRPDELPQEVTMPGTRGLARLGRQARRRGGNAPAES